MWTVSIFLFGKPWQEFGFDNEDGDVTAKQIKEIGDEISQRMNNIAGIAAKLEAAGWVGVLINYGINYTHHKARTKKAVIQMLAEFGIDPQAVDILRE